MNPATEPTANPDVTFFTAVDHTSDPATFVHFMDVVHQTPAFKTAKTLIRQRLVLHQGDSVLDVGCGPGISLLEISEIVGRTGRLAGLDASATMIGEARRRAQAAGVPASFTLGDAHAMPFLDRTFDVCHAERMLMHVPDPAKVIGEMVRVAQPGGRVGVFDFDHDTLVAESVDKETTRTIALTFSDSIRNGWIGRQLPRIFKERGLVDVTVDAVPIFLSTSHLLHCSWVAIARDCRRKASSRPASSRHGGTSCERRRSGATSSSPTHRSSSPASSRRDHGPSDLRRAPASSG